MKSQQLNPLETPALKAENLISAIKKNQKAVVQKILSSEDSEYINFRLYKTLCYDAHNGVFSIIDSREHFFESHPRTPLTTAVYFGRDEMVDWLIQKGANVNLSGPYSPLEYAVLYLKHIVKDANTLKRYQKIYDRLIEHGAKLTENSEDNIDTLMEPFASVTIHILKKK